jgi:DNA-binding MarR family transcriptional regulator
MESLEIVSLLNALQKLERNVSVALMYSRLRLPQFRLLNVLAEMGEATVTQLSERLGITRATASVLVNELIKSGTVAVIENPRDRRSFHIRLTEIGSNKLGVARSDLGVYRDNISRRFSPETIRFLNEFADTILLR